MPAVVSGNTNYQPDAINVGGAVTAGDLGGTPSSDFTTIATISVPAGTLGRNFDFGNMLQQNPFT